MLVPVQQTRVLKTVFWPLWHWTNLRLVQFTHTCTCRDNKMDCCPVKRPDSSVEWSRPLALLCKHVHISIKTLVKLLQQIFPVGPISSCLELKLAF